MGNHASLTTDAHKAKYQIMTKRPVLIAMDALQALNQMKMEKIVLDYKSVGSVISLDLMANHVLKLLKNEYDF